MCHQSLHLFLRPHLSDHWTNTLTRSQVCYSPCGFILSVLLRGGCCKGPLRWETPLCFKRTERPKKLFLTLATSELATCSYYSKASVYLPENKGRCWSFHFFCLKLKRCVAPRGYPTSIESWYSTQKNLWANTWKWVPLRLPLCVVFPLNVNILIVCIHLASCTNVKKQW